MSERTQDKIKAMIVERLFLDVEPASIGDQDDLLTFVENDSVRLFEIVVGLEEEFGVTFADNEFSVETFRTVNGITGVLESKLQGGA